jgi:hypothetical protein
MGGGINRASTESLTCDGDHSGVWGELLQQKEMRLKAVLEELGWQFDQICAIPPGSPRRKTILTE